MELQVIERGAAAGLDPLEFGHAELADRISPLLDRAVLAMYTAHQDRAWTANLIEGSRR